MSISLKELKKNRLTPTERFVLETIEGCKPETLSNGNVNWRKDGNYLCRQDFKKMALYISYQYIWSVLEKQFGLNYDETKDLLTNLLYDYTNKGQLKIYFI